jgi:hypothetical protein
MIKRILRFVFPSEVLNVRCSLGTTTIITRLREQTRIGVLFFGPSDCVFNQTIEADRFKIELNLFKSWFSNRQNSFLPKMSGTLEPDRRGTVIRVMMKLSEFVRIFMSFWFGFAALWTVLVMLGQTGFVAIKGTENVQIPFIGLGMIAFGLVLVGGGAWTSRNRPFLIFWCLVRLNRR